MKSIIQVLTSRQMASILLMGFASGLPLSLTGGTLQAWMTDAKVDLKTIGLFSLVGMPYTFKFLWSPLMDRFVPPFLGRRRGWIITMQVLLTLAIAWMAILDPAQSTAMVALVAVLVAFFSASQDIVIDAYRAEALTKEELGIASGYYIMGYRVALLVSGAAALAMAQTLPWRMVYLIMAAIMAVNIIITLWSPEPVSSEKSPKSMQEAVILPFKEFFSRPGVWEVLLFIVVYKLDVVVATALSTTFMMQIGFEKLEIAAVMKGFGMVATIFGTLWGGILMMKMGMKRSLWFFGIFQGISGLSFTALAHYGKSYPLMVSSIALENLCSGMGTAAYSAFLMSLCNKSFTATQYALLTSLMALTRTWAGAPTGYMAEALGWEKYFVVSMLLMIPGLLLLTRYDKWKIES